MKSIVGCPARVLGLTAQEEQSLAADTADILATIEEAAWERLTDALADPEHPYRNLTLATIDGDGHPHARLLVLREVDTPRRLLEFHTDTRSPKWAEIEKQPRLSVLGYDPVERLQLRLRGTTQLYPPGSDANVMAWNSLSTWTRTTYCGGPPGDALAHPEPGGLRPNPPSEAETEIGRARFGVIVFQSTILDWFQHNRGQVRRAVFQYSEHGSLADASWIAP